MIPSPLQRLHIMPVDLPCTADTCLQVEAMQSRVAKAEGAMAKDNPEVFATVQVQSHAWLEPRHISGIGRAPPAECHDVQLNLPFVSVSPPSALSFPSARQQHRAGPAPRPDEAAEAHVSPAHHDGLEAAENSV